MERWMGRVALVTGASVGIGAAICKKLTEEGLTVVGCARNVDKIQKLADSLANAKGKLHARQCDVTKEFEIVALFDWIRNTLGGVDVCVNNAGLGNIATLLGPEATVASWRNMMDVNVIALCLCTKLAIESMRERGVDDGQIIHINSMSGHRVPLGSTNHFYCATKHAVTALTEGHRQELRELKSNIRVAAISPGYVETEFLVNASFSPEVSKSIYGSMKCMQGADIADGVVYILSSPPNVQVHDILMRPTEQIN